MYIATLNRIENYIKLESHNKNSGEKTIEFIDLAQYALKNIDMQIEESYAFSIRDMITNNSIPRPIIRSAAFSSHAYRLFPGGGFSINNSRGRYKEGIINGSNSSHVNAFVASVNSIVRDERVLVLALGATGASALTSATYFFKQGKKSVGAWLALATTLGAGATVIASAWNLLDAREDANFHWGEV